VRREIGEEALEVHAVRSRMSTVQSSSSVGPIRKTMGSGLDFSDVAKPKF